MVGRHLHYHSEDLPGLALGFAGRRKCFSWAPSHPSDANGDYQAGPLEAKAEGFENFVHRHRIWLPSTFEGHQQGPSETPVGSPGALITLEFHQQHIVRHGPATLWIPPSPRQTTLLPVLIFASFGLAHLPRQTYDIMGVAQ